MFGVLIARGHFFAQSGASRCRGLRVLPVQNAPEEDGGKPAGG